ncbi:family 43 glycosylhydrolase [Streptomyces sp. MAR4 CNX-425]|uniref:family 43 glycosylhydrolase n=1 Tax=Streptomyces sp. MAR4 CNX-425 TaxID=3406343 RepID=UPI003B506485
MRRTWTRTGLLLCALLAGLLPLTSATAADPAPEPAPAERAAADEAPGTYTNPVTDGVVDTFPDPVTIRGKDGYWYAYGTMNPVFQSDGEQHERMLPILRSADLVDWEYAGEVFTPGTQPAWHRGSRLWAPDIRYNDGHYTLSYSVPGRNTVGAATAPTPTGPWTDTGPVLPTPSGCPTGGIDQAQFTDRDGRTYLYWGSYDILCVAEMNAERTRITGEVTQVAQGRRMEGAFVVRRDGFYYLFYSDAGCCDGAYSGYQVKAGRSTSPTGPFRDDEGVDLMAPTSKGAVVVGANGNRWIGPGHNGLATDLAGQDWLMYHGIPADNPDLDRFPGLDRQLTRRPMLMDRLDWIDGWPVVRAGAGASEGPQRAPVTDWDAGGTFAGGSLDGWRAEGAGTGGWSLADDADSGPYATHRGATDPAFLVTGEAAPRDLRAEADLRVASAGGAAGLTVAYRDPRNHTIAWLDRARGALVTDVVVRGRSRGERVTPLPASYDWDSWHNVTAEVRRGRMTVEVSGDRLRDAVAVQERRLPGAATRPGAVGTAARGDGAAADNVGAARLYEPVTERVLEPATGRLLPGHSDEFTAGAVPGTEPGSPWRWLRGPAPGVRTEDGDLVWPTQNAELYLRNNTASVLLRDAPEGDYTVTAKLDFDPAEPNQQAGLLLYADDDKYVKMTHSVLPLNRGGGTVLDVSEFAKEGARPTTSPPTPVANAPMFGGPTADRMWLRLSYHHDAGTGERGEHEVRAATSRDGRTWVHSGVWTLPGDERLRIGLVSMNREGAVAKFDYVRTHRTR